MAQLKQRCGSRVHLCLDADKNGAGQTAVHGLSARLRQAGVEVLRVQLPSGQDPASLFAAGLSGQDFQRYLERARS